MGKNSNNTCLNQLKAGNNSVFLANATEKQFTFAAATTGKVGTTKIADVTGVVAVQIFGVVNTTLTITAGATIEVGTALSTAALIALTAGDALDINEIWHDATPDSSIELETVVTTKIVTQDINYKVTTNTLTAGAITFYIRWSPISEDGNVVIA